MNININNYINNNLNLFSEYLYSKRWFRSKNKKIEKILIAEKFEVFREHGKFLFCVINIFFENNYSEAYFVPLEILNNNFNNIFFRDAFENKLFVKSLLEFFLSGENNLANLLFVERQENLNKNNYKNILIDENKIILSSSEQSNTCIFYDNKLVLKIFRKLETELNPDAEILQALKNFEYIPDCLGVINYKNNYKNLSKYSSFCLIQEFVKNSVNAWEYFQKNLQENLNKNNIKKLEADFESLGKVTGLLHKALNSISQEYKQEYNTKLFVERTKFIFEAKIQDFENLLNSQKILLSLDKNIINLLRNKIIIFKKFSGDIENILLSCDFNLIRIHGDFHLGQVLKTPEKFVIIDFEGEPLVSIQERKYKNSALKDIAGMTRSIDYLINLNNINNLNFRQIFLDSYLRETAGEKFLPSDKNLLIKILEFFELDKALYEFKYEAENRPEYLKIPAKKLLSIKINI